MSSVDGVRAGSAVVFSSGEENAEGSDLIIVAYEAQIGADSEELEIQVRGRLREHFTVEPDHVVELSPRSIPRSPNGKNRRHLVRKLYAAGQLDRRDRNIEFEGLYRALLRTRHDFLRMSQTVTARVKKFLDRS